MAQLTINLPDDVKRDFKAIAQQNGVDMTTILRRHIEDVIAGQVDLHPSKTKNKPSAVSGITTKEDSS